MSFELNELPPSLNKYMRMHFHVRSKIFNKIKNDIHKLVLGKLPVEPLTSYQITFTRFTIRPLDIDNLVASFKPVLDSLTLFEVIEDDRWEMPTKILYKQTRVKHKPEQKITVYVTDSKVAQELHRGI